MSPPLISDYKKGFTVKRLFETFLGGPRLFFTPIVYIILQVGFFILPAIILSIINLTSSDYWSINWKAIIIGLAVLVIDLSLALLLSYLKRVKRTATISPIFSRRGSTFLAQEDHVEYESFFHHSTWIFVAPNATVNDPFYVLGIMSSSISFALCAPLVIIETGNVILRGFSLFTLCNARYSAVISLPPELATFDPIRKKNLLYRPFYVNILGFGYLAVKSCTIESDDNFWFLLCLSILPILWGIGFLPPLDAFFPWLAETILKIMGGSPTYFYIGNFLAVLITLICPVIVFISRLERVFIILIQCSLGYGISCDMGLLLRLKTFSKDGQSQEKNPQNTKLSFIKFLKPILIILLSLVCTSIPMIFIFLNDRRIEIIFLIMSLTINILTFVLRQFLIGKITKLWNKIYIFHSILDLSLMFIIQIWISIEISSNNNSDGLSLKQLIIQILTIRAFTLTIMHPRFSSFDMSFVTILNIYKINGELNFIILLFIVSILRERIIVFFRHLSFVTIVMYSTIQTLLLGNICQIYGIIILLLPFSISSLIVASLVENSTLSTVFTLPIFLIGFPRPNSFWKGSWFQKSIVNHTGGNKNLDWIIYSDIGKSLTSNFVQYFNQAHLKLEAGNCYVARYEDRLLFLRILYSGWNFAYIQIKGLEMQEQTSCHHQEAAAMDERFEKSFGTNRNSLFVPQCQPISGILRPLMIFHVTTYSESKSIISNLKTKDEKRIFQKMFFKTFSYLWMRTNPLFHGIDSYMKSICSGFNLHHSTENSSMASTPSSSIRGHSFEYEMSTTHENIEKNSIFNHPNSIDDSDNINHRNIQKRNVKKISFENDLPVWNLSHLPTLPGMEFHKINNESNTTTTNKFIQNKLNEDENNTRTSFVNKNLLTNSWINKCIGDAILSPDIKNKVEELCWEIWNIIFSENNDSIQIDLQRFFTENFVQEIFQMMKLDRLPLADISVQAFRYASKLALDEIYYNSLEEIGGYEENIFLELTYFEEHCVKFCTPSEIGTFIQQKDERIISMVKSEDELITYLKIFNYETRGVEFYIGEMSRSCIEGIWSNLNMELLYLTSDDDERFSIQQDKYLLRNITTQCANSPFGYPVYEATFRINLFNFNVDHI